jgi:hypothetical protein
MLGVIVLVLVFSAGTIITLGIVGMQLWAKLRAIDVLRIYAERGEEPPASVVEAVNQVGRPPSPPPPPPPHLRRGWHFSHFAGAIVIAIGAAGIAWWQWLTPSRLAPGATIIAAVVAILFTAHAAARLVAALNSDGRG